MKYRQYRFKFYLNASHAIYINGTLGQRHPHTWEIMVNILKLKENFIQFNSLEKKIESFMSKYQDQFINEIEPFDVLNPTLENCTRYFMEQFEMILNQEGFVLLMIEMSETPTRSYVINCLDEDDSESKQSIDTLVDAILENIKKGDLLDGKD